MLYPVVLAGGSGTRLWPLSRQLYPKQFLNLIDDRFTMLQATINRLDGLDVAEPIVVCNEDHRFLAAEQMRQISKVGCKIILEPFSKNTAPAIALAALELIEREEDPLMIVLAADHDIQKEEEFHNKVKIAVSIAKSGRLVTFGIKPTHAETGYGYIRAGEHVPGGACEVDAFVEKPDIETAQLYLDSGQYYWNSGMFLFKASVYLKELGIYRPDILRACEQSIAERTQDFDFIRIKTDEFYSCPSESIDFAVMENTSLSVMVELDAGWSDVGSWSSLWNLRDKDAAGNSCRGDVITYQTTNSLVQAEGRLVVTLGVDDLAVVETKDVVMISSKAQAQDIGLIVKSLKSDGRLECVNHMKVFRPWGVYDSIDQGERYQVKRITVKPGAKLSVQMHHHRAEHWVVVSGTAKVTNGETEYLVTENQSTYIPVGQIHSLENPGVIDLELIEVQSGSYLGEDDIVRVEDRYGRS